jgi:hypothetical protein
VVIAREQRLIRQLSLLDSRTAEIISVEDPAVSGEVSSSVEDPPLDISSLIPGDLALSPFTWSAIDGLSDDF